MSLLCAFAVTVITAVAGVDAYSTYWNSIPNGMYVYRNGQYFAGVGHLNASGGGALNPFGTAFQAANHTWTTALCQADSDGDGYTNGHELGDPNCMWSFGATPTRLTNISHPGFADSTPAPTTNMAVPTTPPPPMGTPSDGTTPTAENFTDVFHIPHSEESPSSGYTDGVWFGVQFDLPMGCAASPSFTSLAVYIMDTENDRIRKWNVTSGAVTTFAGGGMMTYDGQGTDATFTAPDSAVMLADGVTMIVSDGSCLRTVDTVTAQVVTLAGTCGLEATVDGVGGNARFVQTLGMAFDKANGAVYVADMGIGLSGSQLIRRVETASGIVSTFFGTAHTASSSQVSTDHPCGVAFRPSNGDVVYSERGYVRYYSVSFGVIMNAVGDGTYLSPMDGVGTSARVAWPSRLVAHPHFDHFVLLAENIHAVRLVDLERSSVTELFGQSANEFLISGSGSVASTRYVTGLCYHPSAQLLYVTGQASVSLAVSNWDKYSANGRTVETALDRLSSELQAAHSSRCTCGSVSGCQVPGCGDYFPSDLGFGCLTGTRSNASSASCGANQCPVGSLTASTVQLAPGTSSDDVAAREFACSTAGMDAALASVGAMGNGIFRSIEVVDSASGATRKWPGVPQGRPDTPEGGTCEQYDPRRRSFYATAVSGPKDVVIALDVSASMATEHSTGATRLTASAAAARAVLDTLTSMDNVGIVTYQSVASVVGGHTQVIPATAANVESLSNALGNLVANGGSSFVAAFDRAFDLFPLPSSPSARCNRMILFLSDGAVAESVLPGIATRQAQLGNSSNAVTVHTFGLGSAADADLLQQIACANNGAYWGIPDGADVASAMVRYFEPMMHLGDPVHVPSLLPRGTGMGIGSFKVFSSTRRLIGVVAVTLALEDFSWFDFDDFQAAVGDQPACTPARPSECQLQYERGYVIPRSDVCPSPAPTAAACLAAGNVSRQAPCRSDNTSSAPTLASQFCSIELSNTAQEPLGTVGCTSPGVVPTNVSTGVPMTTEPAVSTPQTLPPDFSWCMRPTTTELYPSHAGACAPLAACEAAFCSCAGTSGTNASMCLSNAPPSLLCGGAEACVNRYFDCVHAVTSYRTNQSSPCYDTASQLYVAELAASGNGYDGSALQQNCEFRACTLLSTSTLFSCAWAVNFTTVCVPERNTPSPAPSPSPTPSDFVAGLRATIRVQGSSFGALLGNATRREALRVAVRTDIAGFLGVSAEYVLILNMFEGSLEVDFAVDNSAGVAPAVLSSSLQSVSSSSTWMSNIQFVYRTVSNETLTTTDVVLTESLAPAATTTGAPGPTPAATAASALMVATIRIAGSDFGQLLGDTGARSSLELSLKVDLAAALRVSSDFVQILLMQASTTTGLSVEFAVLQGPAVSGGDLRSSLFAIGQASLLPNVVIQYSAWSSEALTTVTVVQVSAVTSAPTNAPPVLTETPASPGSSGSDSLLLIIIVVVVAVVIIVVAIIVGCVCCRRHGDPRPYEDEKINRGGNRGGFGPQESPTGGAIDVGGSPLHDLRTAGLNDGDASSAAGSTGLYPGAKKGHGSGLELTTSVKEAKADDDEGRRTPDHQQAPPEEAHNIDESREDDGPDPDAAVAADGMRSSALHRSESIALTMSIKEDGTTTASGTSSDDDGNEHSNKDAAADGERADESSQEKKGGDKSRPGHDEDERGTHRVHSGHHHHHHHRHQEEKEPAESLS